MSGTFYITTPIYYVNAEPHLGHAYSTIVADVAARFHRLAGDQVRFQTGTDEHGDKIVEAAARQGRTPQEYTDRISGLFRAAWPPLHIEPDRFIRTTDPDHQAVVQRVLAQVHAAGDIYFAKYGGHYCVGCERFYTEREMVDGKCPDHQTPLVYIEEENYFFRMSKYQDWLVRHINENPDFIRPERYKNEILAMLAEPLDDLCISRPKTRLTWGIELPFDPNYVTYVWFDALLNYITGLEWPEGELFPRFWPAAQHLIAKDILKPHAIFWPTMLKAAGLAPYQHLNVHGYWNIEGAKMSKSLGNVVAPLDLANVYGPEAFRYFLLREMSFGLDASFSETLLVDRYNADLANDLGNLVSRVLNMVARYRDGLVPAAAPAAGDEADREMAELTARVLADYRRDMNDFHFHKALMALWEIISAANKYVVRSEPWVLAKDPASAPRLDQVLHTLVHTLAQVTILLWPVMPATAEALAGQLGLPAPLSLGLDRVADPDLLPAGAVITPGEALFPRVDTDKVKAKAQKAEAKHHQEAPAKPAKKDKAKAKAPSGPAPEITIDEFARLELKVGRILSAAPVQGADRLLHLSVDLGETEPRSIVAGIAQHYSLTDLPGRSVVVVANLRPVTLKGTLSQGMVLAASAPDGHLALVTPSGDLPPGSRVK
ncbi:MAG: methionine--tRNA ligase [Deltaproteobacteria bacterium]|nr:methionine--tRNA ligase [Deltaproteobacteria bacterium]